MRIFVTRLFFRADNPPYQFNFPFVEYLRYRDDLTRFATLIVSVKYLCWRGFKSKRKNARISSIITLLHYLSQKIPNKYVFFPSYNYSTKFIILVVSALNLTKQPNIVAV